MRGIQVLTDSNYLFTRITPAHAGNTLQTHAAAASLRDHPRACGEYDVSVIVPAGTRGSPPRMRGILSSQGGIGKTSGITPAHAGNTPDAGRK